MDLTLVQRRYKCLECIYYYDPAVGDPTQGVLPGTPFLDLPEGWRCPVCYVGKNRFRPLRR